MKERRGRRKDQKESKKVIAHNKKKRGTGKREREIRAEEDKRCSVSDCVVKVWEVAVDKKEKDGREPKNYEMQAITRM